MMNWEWEETSRGIRLTKYVGHEAEVVLPSEIDGQPVRMLASHAFYENGMDIERIVTPSTLRIIEPYACEFCMSLTDFVIAEGVEVLGREFLIATQIEKLSIPSTVYWIEEPAELGLTLDISPENPWYYIDGTALFRRGTHPEEIGISYSDIVGGDLSEDGCFNIADDRLPEDGSRDTTGGVSLEAILPEMEFQDYTVPEGVTYIAHDAFESQDMLERITLPATLVDIAEGVLSYPKSHFAKGRGIHKIVIADGNPVFFTDESGLYKRLPDGGIELIKYLGRKHDLVLGDAIHVVGRGAFIKSKVEQITIPKTVEKIYPDAFLDCPINEVDFQAFGFSMYFPSEHAYVLKQVLEGFGQNDKLYDFFYYDRVLRDDALNAEKAKMCIYRLHYPKDLSEETAQYLRGRIAEKLAFFVEQLGERGELMTLQWMCELGFFDRDNIDDLIEGLNRAGHREAMAVLMDYKNRELGNEEFSFEL